MGNLSVFLILFSILKITTSQPVLQSVSGYQWVEVLAKDADGNTLTDIGRIRFNQLFKNTMRFTNGGPIARLCYSGCVSSHQKILYHRITELTVDLYTYMKTEWKSAGNILNTDFRLHSSYSDVLSNTNPWQYCNYDVCTYKYITVYIY